MYIAKLVNDEVLEQDKYNDESIKRESKILWQQMSSDRPSFYYFPIQANALQDDTDLLS